MLKSCTELYFRWAASGAIPASWYVRGLPPKAELTPRTGRLSLEIVSHCWNYANLLIFQLSSLHQHLSDDLDVTMTVYTGAEDEATCRLVEYFASIAPGNLKYSLRILPKEQLFRRAIGRNQAALESKADWVWFTDCDLLFGEGCLRGLASALQGLQEPLVFPQQEYCSSLLPEESELIQSGYCEPSVVMVDTSGFKALPRTRATGPLQITHGDVARRVGYCRDIRYYQQSSKTWCKAIEDRAFRWLLGTQGHPIEVPSVYRIRHQRKGRYTGRRWHSNLRSKIRQLSLKVKERR
jgi:hypothetical protein